MEEGREVDGRVGKGGVREEEAEWEGEGAEWEGEGAEWEGEEGGIEVF